jgi:hypothetical protein
MHVIRRAICGAAALLAMVAAPVVAQMHTTAAGYGGGFVTFGAFNPDVEGEELALDAGWVVTGFGETWHVLGGRVGTRLNLAFTQRPLPIPEQPRDINTWLLDANLMLRLLSPAEDNPIAPFLSAGVGVISYGLGTGAPVTFPEAGVVYSGDDERRLTVVGGAGIDIVPAGFQVGGLPLGIRLEAANHVTLHSPFRDFEGERLGPIHNLRVGASLLGRGWF